MNTRLLQSVLILTLLCSGGARAQAVQSPEAVIATAERFVIAQLGPPAADVAYHATARPLDSRLRLAPCTQPLAATLASPAQMAARVSISVSCTQPRWSLLVPVSIETELPVLVLLQAAARDAKLTSADVEIRRMRVAGLATTYIRDPAQLADRHLKTAAAPGTALDVGLLVPDILVKRGQRVTLVATVAGLEVRAQGEAISDATANGRVRVLNLDSRRIVEGQVETRDRVRVSL
jgi:flagellar basal body P-ring formation protein FlgA